MTAREYERGTQQQTRPAHLTHRPDTPFGPLQAAGNRAMAGLLAPRVQRFEAGDNLDAGFVAGDAAEVGSPATGEAEVDVSVDATVDEMTAAIAAGVDGGSTTALLQQDAAGQSSGDTAAAAAESAGDGTESAVEDDGAVAQTMRADVQRDPTTDPGQPRPASPGDLLDAVLALQSVKAVFDRLADFAIAQLKKAGVPATVTLATFFIPAGLIAANQGLGVTKFTFKTPAIALGADKQGGKRSITFSLSVDVDPKTGGGGTLGAELRF